MKNRDFNSLETFSIKDEWEGIGLKHSFSDKVRLWTVPVYTLNESEAGIEKTYQYISLLVQRPMILEKNENARFSAKVEIG